MFKQLKNGVIHGLGFILVLSLIGITYAAITNVSSGETLTASKFNEVIDATVPSGAVIAFNLTTCPTGWIEYTPAYGRFIRGIDKSGTNIDPDGQRSLEDYQSDDFKNHNHRYLTYSDVVVGAGSNYGGSANGQGVFTQDTGGTETRPKNVALLYCVKQ